MKSISTLIVLLALTSCANQPQTSGDQAMAMAMLPADASQCPEPRPTKPGMSLCTMDYRPVCGVWAHGMRKARQTYGNACGACDDPQVIGYTEGACP